MDLITPGQDVAAPQLTPALEEKSAENLVVQNCEKVSRSEQRRSPQSNHNVGTHSGLGTTYDEVKSKYLPLRSSAFLSSHLLLAAKKGDISREMIFSDLTASLCERRLFGHFAIVFAKF